MKEKKYYCLLLNGCFDKEYHYVSRETHSIIKNVLRKEYTDLSTLEEDFMELDDKITINEDHWLVEGSFPVIAEEIDGKMIDCVSKKEIGKSVDGVNYRGLSYRYASETNHKMTELLLSILDEESIKRYIEGQSKIEEFLVSIYDMNYPKKKYYSIYPNDTTVLVNAIKINEKLVDLITLEPFYKEKPNVITRNLTFEKKERITCDLAKKILKKYKDFIDNVYKEEYIENIHQLQTANISRYNTYISLNKDRDFWTRTDLKTKKRIKKK